MSTGESYNLAGQRKVSDAEAREHHDELLAKRITDIPNDLQNIFDYDTRNDGQPVYVGYGAKGLGTGEDGWLIYEYSYNGDGFITSKKTAYGKWDNRSSLTYE